MKLIKKFIFIFFLIQLASTSYNPSMVKAKTYDFEISPYLLEIKKDSAIVAFHLNTALTAKVRVYFADKAYDFYSKNPQKSHFVKISNLKPNSVYRYEVIAGKNNEVTTPENDLSYYIKTACIIGDSFTFVVYGDPRSENIYNNKYHSEIIEQISIYDPVFALVLGDMVNNGQKKLLWKNFFNIESYLLRHCAIYPVLGDNDYSLAKGIYKNYFPMLKKPYYKFNWGGVHFFGLNAWDTKGLQNSNEFDQNSKQIKWLKTELAKKVAQNALFRVVFLHDPVYISRGRSSQVLKNTLIHIFEKYKVNVVFSSWHMYERSNYNGVNYIITGGAGADLIWMDKNLSYPSQAEAKAHHFCKVQIQSKSMNISAINENGTVLDTITLTPSNKNTESIQNLAKKIAKTLIIGPNKKNLIQIPINLFSTNCTYCKLLLNKILPKIAKKHNVVLKVSYYDMDIKEAYELFLNAASNYKGENNSDLPALIIGKNMLLGKSEINQHLEKSVKKALKNPEKYNYNILDSNKTINENLSTENFDVLTFSIVSFAGLIDGINPCAFATIILLISYISLFGFSQKQLIYTGICFTLGVFLTYFAIGLLFYSSLKFLIVNSSVALIINYILLVVVAFIGILSLMDFILILFKKDKIILKLPKIFSLKIEEKIKTFSKNPKKIIATAFILGVLISGLEFTCTGQVYIPIVTMISNPVYRIKAVFYLVIYNIFFILPLILVFILTFFGSNLKKIQTNKITTSLIKFAHVVIFGIMSLIILYNLGYL